MLVLAALVLLGTGLAVNGEVHSLKYIYTAFSKPLGLQGLHEFTAMGLLNNRLIDYFDSDHPSKIPKQKWMETHLTQDYWEKGTQSRKSKQQWFKVNIEILMKRMNQSETDVHVLQWMHGCEGETQPNNTLKFKSGKDMYSYDGNDFLSFDDAHSVWVAPIDAAVQTKRKWDGVQVLKDYTKGYLETECMEWLSKFNTFEHQEIRKASPPAVHLFAKDAKVETNIMLTCLATGFYPKDISVNIKRNGRTLSRVDGLMSSGVRPNQDGTHQIRKSVEILKSDVSNYTCHVIHTATDVDVHSVWDHSLPPSAEPPTLAFVAVGVLFLIIAAVALGLIVWKKTRRGYNNPNQQASSDSELNDVSSDSRVAPVLDPSAPGVNDKAAKTGSDDSLSADSGHSSNSRKSSSSGSDKKGSDSSLNSNGNNDSSGDPGCVGSHQSTPLLDGGN